MTNRDRMAAAGSLRPGLGTTGKAAMDAGGLNSMEATTLILDAGEKGVIGNMIVENVNDAPIQLSVRGEGPVLRDKMIIRPEDATTPCLKVYYAVMTMYLDPRTFDRSYKPFLDMCRELVTAVPSTGLLMADIGEHLLEGDFRSAFLKCFDLLRYEEILEKAARESRKGKKKMAAAGV